MKHIIYGFVYLFLTITPAFSKIYTSQFLEFELPIGWDCNLEGSEWVCQSENVDRKKEAIIIFAAKARGPDDALPDYQKHLKQSKTFQLPGGVTQVSEPKLNQIEIIKNHHWVSSLHLASEVPGFYTQYFATVKSALGIAVTFSVAKDHYQEYRATINKLMRSLKPFSPNEINQAQEFPNKQKEEDIIGRIEFATAPASIEPTSKEDQVSLGSHKLQNYAFPLLLLICFGYFGFRKGTRKINKKK